MGARSFERLTPQRWLDEGPAAAVRPRRRLTYIDAALAPLAGRVEHEVLEDLRSALTLLIGTQAVIALLDVCELDDRRAPQVTRWAARALVRDVPDRKRGPVSTGS